jgi:hypothetical protein
MRTSNFLIVYHLTKTADGHDEFSREQIKEKRMVVSVTNNLSEIFTDLLSAHRNDSIIGIEIVSVVNLIDNPKIKGMSYFVNIPGY